MRTLCLLINITTCSPLSPLSSLATTPDGLDLANGISMDPPKHDLQRQAVQGVVAPQNLKEMEGLIRTRAQEVLDDLPIGVPFDWVQEVSIELTARMLATLLDFPYERRHKLVYWSDIVAASPETTGGDVDINDTVHWRCRYGQAIFRPLAFKGGEKGCRREAWF